MVSRTRVPIPLYFQTLKIIIGNVEKLVDCRPKDVHDWRKIADGFENRWGFPHVIGAIDGKHCRIQNYPGDGSRNYNYKHFHSTVLLAVVDSEYR